MKLAAKEYNKAYYEKNKQQIISRHKKWRDANKEKIALSSYKYNIKKKYGIDIEKYDELLEHQNSCCAICGIHQSKRNRRLSVDHNHKTGDVRGLLCHHCNACLAWLENYNINISRHINYNMEIKQCG